MSTSTSDSCPSEKPEPEDLAGIPVCKEEDGFASRVGAARGSGASTVRPTSPDVPLTLPTADDLAGIPVSVEGNEIVEARPRRPHRHE